MINCRFLTTETNLKALYIFDLMFFNTTSSVNLIVVTIQIFVYICVFEEKQHQETFHLLEMKAHFKTSCISEMKAYFETSLILEMKAHFKTFYILEMKAHFEVKRN